MEGFSSRLSTLDRINTVNCYHMDILEQNGSRSHSDGRG